jgi:hypothetical protein
LIPLCQHENRKPDCKPKRTTEVDETFLKLYCAALGGVASQLEQMHSIEGLPLQDIHAKNLVEREGFAVKRAYRMASLALQELQEVSEFNQKLS